MNFLKDPRFQGIEKFERKVWLSSPTMHGDEQRWVDEAIRTNWVSTVGANINEVEQQMAAYLDCQYAVGLSCGTAALHLAVKLAGEKLYGQARPNQGTLQGHRVFCSDVTFDASVNPVAYEDGEAVFIDTERDTWNMDPAALEKAFSLYPDVKLIVLAHLYGTPGKIDEIRSIADRHGALIVEDAAESLGATYRSRQTGTFGDYNAISFNGNNVSKDMLPIVLHNPGTVVGHVSYEVSKATGLPVTCKVCLGNLDTNCCAIGGGAAEVGTQLLIMGTAGVSIFVTDKNGLDPDGRITVRTNPGFGNWQNYIMTNTGASAFRWFRDALASMEVATSRLMGVDPYDIITQTASHSKPGANGVTALTCIQGSHTRVKNEKARGGFFGITLGTTKADMAEAILEGICFEMKDIMAMNQELSGEVKHVRLCGGVAKSPMWCQMFADILNRPVELTEVAELGALGAAMCAGIGVGLFADCYDAVNKCVKITKVYKPDERKVPEYEEAFKVWERCYNVSNEKIYI